jgi:outer membrane protein assembly factor BamD
MLRHVSILVLLCLTAVLAAPADARPRRETPEKLYEQGLKQLKRGYYDEAITNFDKVRNHFPLNSYSVMAELRVADCLYEKSDFISAVDAYQQFVRLHPQHEELDYAHMRIGRSYFKQTNRIPGNDQTYTQLTLKALAEFETRYPQSDYVAEVVQMRSRCRTRLARTETQVGDFYYWQGMQRRKEDRAQSAFHAASRRYSGVLVDYPDTPLFRRSLYRYGMSQYRLGNHTEAIPRLEEVVERFPGTVQARKAARQLPKVREAAAAPPAETPVPAPAD